MLYYNRIDISDDIDVNSHSHIILMMSIDLDSISILNIHGVDCFCVINRNRKSEAIIF